MAGNEQLLLKAVRGGMEKLKLRWLFFIISNLKTNLNDGRHENHCLKKDHLWTWRIIDGFDYPTLSVSDWHG
jgi:hypothetical protein